MQVCCPVDVIIMDVLHNNYVSHTKLSLPSVGALKTLMMPLLQHVVDVHVPQHHVQQLQLHVPKILAQRKVERSKVRSQLKTFLIQRTKQRTLITQWIKMAKRMMTHMSVCLYLSSRAVLNYYTTENSEPFYKTRIVF